MKGLCHPTPQLPPSACTADSIKEIGWEDNWEESQSPVCMGGHVSVGPTCKELTDLGPDLRRKVIKAVDGYCAPNVVEYTRLLDEGTKQLYEGPRTIIAESLVQIHHPSEEGNGPFTRGNYVCVDGRWSRKKHNKPEKNCDWVGRKPLKRCGKKDDGGTTAHKVCRAACNTCI